jgi:RNA polymerase sigma factor (sigma-70 family)
MPDGNVRDSLGGVLGRLLRQISEDEPRNSELLVRFVTERDESAFRALIGRHGPMVLRVCSRILGRGHDIEDAVQATFLVLVRKAAEIRTSESVGSWLFGMAHRVSMKMRTAAARRCCHEREAAWLMERSPLAGLAAREAQEVFDAELTGLPERLPAPLVLCCLEGLTRDEAARQLGLTPGTLKSRLERGRSLLRTKLGRRGLTAPAALLADLLGSVSTTPAAVAADLVDAAMRIASVGGATRSESDVSAAVIATAEGVVRAMTPSNIKMGTALLGARQLRRMWDSLS